MNKNEFKALVSLLDDDDTNIIEEVEKKIKTMGHKIIPFLEKEWMETSNQIIQSKIENLIQSYQLELLRERINDWVCYESQDLIKGLWLIATYQYPNIELSKVKESLEKICYEAWFHFTTSPNKIEQIKSLNQVFFDKLNFKSNIDNFHSPNNSMINIVLESKRGNPISLCIVYMLIAKRLKIPIYGVNLPNLFILTHTDKKSSPLYISVFNRGLIFSKKDIENYISELKITLKDHYFLPCSNIDIIQRMLQNLMISFEKLDLHSKANEIENIIQSIINQRANTNNFTE